MRVKNLSSHALRTHAVVFDEGDEAVRGLEELAERLDLDGAHLHGIGAFSESTIAYFNAEANRYDEIEIGEQCEVLSFVGNLGRFDGTGEPKVHAHVVLGHADGSTSGGHLVRGVVRPTLELFVTVPGGSIVRVPGDGPLALIDLDS